MEKRKLVASIWVLLATTVITFSPICVYNILGWLYFGCGRCGSGCPLDCNGIGTIMGTPFAWYYPGINFVISAFGLIVDFFIWLIVVSYIHDYIYRKEVKKKKTGK